MNTPAQPATPAILGAPAVPTAGLLSPRRLRLLLLALSAQAAVQGLGFVSGILWVRLMDPAEFALLTLAMSLMAATAVLADLGLASAVVAIGGRLGSARATWLRVWADACQLQRRLRPWAVAVVLPGLFLLLAQHHSTGLAVALLSGLALSVGLLQARNGLAMSVVRLAGDVAWQQRADLGINALRLLAVALLGLLMPHVSTWLALCLHLLAALCMAALLHRWLHQHAGLGQMPERAAACHTPALQAQLWQQGPNSIFFVFFSQISTWLVAWLGDSTAVAEVGALARLAGVFTVIGVVMATLVQPYMARQSDPQALRVALRLAHALFAGLAAVLLLWAATYPQSLLWLLGPTYAGLERELQWMVASSVLAAWNGAIYSLGCARGWVLPLTWTVVASVGGTVISVFVFDVSQVLGAYQMNTLTALLNLLAIAVFVALRLRADGQNRSYPRQLPPGPAPTGS